MTEFQDYRVTLKLQSLLGTPMQSDTLFGHLAWQVAHAEGAKGVERFLGPFLAGQPPFVLSDAFPKGLLPRPLIPMRTGLESRAGRLTKQDMAGMKRKKKALFVHLKDFNGLIRGEEPAAEPPQNPWQTVSIPHAAIDRATETTTPPAGQFYNTEAMVLKGEEVDIYLRILDSDDWVAWLENAFRKLSIGGFGRDKSVGVGAFKVVSFENWDGFKPTEGAFGFVSLSTFMPAEGDPTDGKWRLRVKRGFLGENAGAGHPFKQPMIQFEPGAAFGTGEETPAPFYGRIVTDMAPGMPQAVQCGLTLAVACTWPRLV